MTLCGPSGHTYTIHQHLNTSTGIKLEFNVQDNGQVSPFGEAAPINSTIFYSGRGTSITAGYDSFPSGQTLPFTYVATNGDNNFQIQETIIGFTAAGPTKRAARLSTSYQRPNGTNENKIINGEIDTENEYYIFLSATADITYYTTGIAGTTDPSYLIRTSANAGYSLSDEGNIAGLKGILPNAGNPITNISNHDFDKTFTKADFNLSSAETANGYIYVVIPSRVNLSANEIYQNPTFNSANGFASGSGIPATVGLTNEYGYGEDYDVFRSVGLSGLNLESGDNIFRIDT